MLLTIRDETVTGKLTNELTLDVLDEQTTVRDLIRSRLYQEVDDFNRRVRAGNAEAIAYNGLVRPTDTEQILNGKPSNGFKAGVRIKQEIDWKQQFEVACDAFDRNGFFILIDDKQAEHLDDLIELKHDTRVSFVRLTQLVGG